MIKKNKRMKLCEANCGVVLSGLSSKKFCSDACKQRAYRARKNHTTFQLFDSRNGISCDQRNADQDLCCVILFNKNEFPIEVSFHRKENAQAYVEESKWNRTNGKFYKVFDFSYDKK